jgi:hypothetical protein
VAFRGVALHEGKHKVVFQYESWMLQTGLLLSLTGTVFWVVLVFRAHRKSAA